MRGHEQYASSGHAAQRAILLYAVCMVAKIARSPSRLDAWAPCRLVCPCRHAEQLEQRRSKAAVIIMCFAGQGASCCPSTAAYKCVWSLPCSRPFPIWEALWSSVCRPKNGYSRQRTKEKRVEREERQERPGFTTRCESPWAWQPCEITREQR